MKAHDFAKDFDLNALDGYKLAATHYEPAAIQASAQAPSLSHEQFIVIGNATGVPRGFYRRFAEYAAVRGVHVVVADYRGIAGSKPAKFAKSLKGFEMEYADWSRFDLAAVVQWAAARGRVWLVGHSLAAHAIGQLPEPNVLQAAYVCGGGAGWHGWMPAPEKYKVQLLWHVLGPIMTRLYGYHPMSKLGMGEDLPIAVYRDWKRWCQYPNYFFDDDAPRAQAITKRFAEVRIPIAAVAATDDLWAPPASRDAFFKHYVNAQLDNINITPASLNVKQIGHMGYYRAQVGTALWPQMMQWLQSKGLVLND